MPVFCPCCNLLVASQDPTRVQVGLKVYHGNCLKKEQAEKEVVIHDLRTAQPASQRLQ